VNTNLFRSEKIIQPAGNTVNNAFARARKAPRRRSKEKEAWVGRKKIMELRAF
jgi:hypothetical protein